MTQDPAQNGAGKVADHQSLATSRAHRWCAANGKWNKCRAGKSVHATFVEHDRSNSLRLANGCPP
jgi:hypothetical protein